MVLTQTLFLSASDLSSIISYQSQPQRVSHHIRFVTRSPRRQEHTTSRIKVISTGPVSPVDPTEDAVALWWTTRSLEGSATVRVLSVGQWRFRRAFRPLASLPESRDCVVFCFSASAQTKRGETPESSNRFPPFAPFSTSGSPDLRSYWLCTTHHFLGPMFRQWRPWPVPGVPELIRRIPRGGELLSFPFLRGFSHGPGRLHSLDRARVEALETLAIP